MAEGGAAAGGVGCSAAGSMPVVPSPGRVRGGSASGLALGPMGFGGPAMPGEAMWSRARRQEALLCRAPGLRGDGAVPCCR
jgi:hypothetical protein